MRRVLMLTGVLMLVLVGLLAVVRQQEPLPQWIYFLREDQLHRVAWDGTHESDLRLSSIHSINLSPDAQWIMWIDNVDQDLHLTSIDLADSRIIATNFNLASWSPDSKNIATISHNDLTIYDIVSNKWHSLSIPDVYVFAYSWSSNSEWILFAGTRNGSVRLFRTRTDSTGFQTYDVSGFMPLWWQIRLAWSPDDQYIAFSIKYEEEAADVYVMQADGTHLQNLTNTGDVDESVAQWSLDGHSIYFTNEYGELFRLQTDGKKSPG